MILNPFIWWIIYFHNGCFLKQFYVDIAIEFISNKISLVLPVFLKSIPQVLSYLRTPTRIVFGEGIKCYFLFSKNDLEDILAANTERKYKLVFNLCYNYSVLHIIYYQYLRQVFMTQHDFNQSLLIFYFCFSL